MPGDQAQLPAVHQLSVRQMHVGDAEPPSATIWQIRLTNMPGLQRDLTRRPVEGVWAPGGEAVKPAGQRIARIVDPDPAGSWSSASVASCISSRSGFSRSARWTTSSSVAPVVCSRFQQTIFIACTPRAPGAGQQRGAEPEPDQRQRIGDSARGHAADEREQHDRHAAGENAGFGAAQRAMPGQRGADRAAQPDRAGTSRLRLAYLRRALRPVFGARLPRARLGRGTLAGMKHDLGRVLQVFLKHRPSSGRRIPRPGS